MEAERDALRAELLGQKQEAAEQLAVIHTARDAAAAELAEASKQLQAAQADVQQLQGRISELETTHKQTQGAHSAASKSLTAAQVGIFALCPLACALVRFLTSMSPTSRHLHCPMCCTLTVPCKVDTHEPTQDNAGYCWVCIT